MKESDFFKQLNRELQDAAPPLSERLKEEPICSALREKSGDGRDSRTRGKTAGRVSKKRLTAILASAAALILVCIVGLTAFFLGPSVSPTVYACMYIDINPSLALTLDENYNVRKVVSRNADADTLIGDESFVSSLTGLSAQEAAVKVAERAAKSGYLSLRGSGSKDDYNEIGVTVRSNAAVKEETLNSIEENLIGFFWRKRRLRVRKRALGKRTWKRRRTIGLWKAVPFPISDGRRTRRACPNWNGWSKTRFNG